MFGDDVLLGAVVSKELLLLVVVVSLDMSGIANLYQHIYGCTIIDAGSASD